MKTKKIKIYLIARVSKEARAWNEEVANVFDESHFEIFVPHRDNPWNYDSLREKLNHQNIQKSVYETDKKAIDDSHLGLALSPFGNDCCWECGYYWGSDKPVAVFIKDQVEEWLGNWLTVGRITYAIAGNLKIFDLLRKFYSLETNKNLFLIEKMSELNELFIHLYKKHYCYLNENQIQNSIHKPKIGEN